MFTPRNAGAVDAAVATGQRELGLVTPGAKTLKYAMVALEREGNGAGVLKLFRGAEEPDRDVYLIGIRSVLVMCESIWCQCAMYT